MKREYDTQTFLADFVKMADLHAFRLNAALREVEKVTPISPEDFAQLDNSQVAYFDMATQRFSKLQDIIGAKVFPLTLEILGEDAPAFIDKLNRLEKLGYLHDAQWWMELREIRNQITHDYPDNYKMLAKHFNEFVERAAELLKFWSEYKVVIKNLQVTAP